MKPALIYNSAMRSYGPVNLHPLLFLIALNVTLFVITLFRPETVITAFGLNTAQVSQHPWTIITSMFIHDPIVWTHILFNMISLYFLGGFVIRVLGEKRFLAVYFIGGIVGNLFLILYSHLTGHTILGYGASGAVFALGGLLAITVPKAPVLIFPIPVPMPLWVAILIFFFVLIVLPMGIATRIGWQAHLGGLLLGLLAGLVFKKRRRMYYF